MLMALTLRVCGSKSSKVDACKRKKKEGKKKELRQMDQDYRSFLSSTHSIRKN